MNPKKQLYYDDATKGKDVQDRHYHHHLDWYYDWYYSNGSRKNWAGNCNKNWDGQTGRLAVKLVD